MRHNVVVRKNKHRAWDYINEKMYYEEENRVIFEYFSGIMGILNFDPEEEVVGTTIDMGFFPGKIMRCTGLEDVLKKDVYEDDILTDRFNRWFVVFWKQDEAAFFLRKYNEEEVFPMGTGMAEWVIGNTCEDPELLKVQ